LVTPPTPRNHWVCLTLVAALLGVALPVTAAPTTAADWLALGNQRAAASEYASALRAYRQAAALAPTSPDAWYGVGWALFSLGKPQSAVAPLRRALHLRPAHRAAAQTLGEAYLASGRYSEGADTFRRLARTGPEAYDVQFGLGRALLGAQRYGEAVAPLESAVRLRPDLPRPRVLLGRAWLRQRQYIRAEDSLLAAYNLDPAFEPAWGELAGLYRVTARLGQADAFLALQLAKHPRDVSLLQSRLHGARALRRRDLLRVTLRQLLAALPARKTPPYRRELALDYLAAHDLIPAEAQLRAAVQVEPGNPDNAALLAQVLLAAGKSAEAASVLRGVPPERVGRPEVYLALAEAALAGGHAEEALTQARRALALAPGSEPALRVAREAAVRAGSSPEIIEFSRRLVALHPRAGPARLTLAQDLERAGRAAETIYQYHLAASLEGPAGLEALRALTRVAAAAGNPAWRLALQRRLAAAAPLALPLELLDALLAQHRYAEASAALQQALLRSPGSPELLARRARLLRESGRIEQAESVLESALGENPTHPALNLEIGLLAAGQSNPVAALPFLHWGLQDEARLPEACPALATCAARAGQTDAAAESLRTLLRTHPDGSPESVAGLESLAHLYSLASGPESSVAQMRALVDARPERTDLALAAAAQCGRAGFPALAGRYYERAGQAPAHAPSALRRAAAAYVAAGDSAGFLRVAAGYLVREARDPEALALLAEMQALPQALSSAAQATILSLLQAPSRSPDYQRARIELFASRGRLDALQAILTARALHTRAPSDRVALAFLQARRGDPEAALRTLSILAPADLSPPAVARLRADLLQQLGQTDAALAMLEGVVSTGAEVALERADLLSEAQRPGEALGEYLQSLRAGAEAEGVLVRVRDLWTDRQVSLSALLIGLGETAAALPNPAPVSQFVTDHLPADEPIVQEWLAFYACPGGADGEDGAP